MQHLVMTMLPVCRHQKILLAKAVGFTGMRIIHIVRGTGCTKYATLLSRHTRQNDNLQHFLSSKTGPPKKTTGQGITSCNDMKTHPPQATHRLLSSAYSHSSVLPVLQTCRWYA